VRKAFASAINTDDIRRNVYNGFAEPITWAMTPAQFGYDANLKSAYSFDLNAAKESLVAAGKDLGFGPGKPRDMLILYNAAAPWQGYIVTQVAANINQLDVGLKLDVKALSFTEYVNSWRSPLTGFSVHSAFSLTRERCYHPRNLLMLATTQHSLRTHAARFAAAALLPHPLAGSAR
jgi:ABC-type transport system substrate-binding protein